MARQKGLIKLEGTLDDITFYEGVGKAGKREMLAKTKSAIPADRIANDPAFQRTRENNTEFGNAASFAKLLRLGFNAYSKGTQSSLAKITLAAIRQYDTVSARGQRNINEVTNFADFLGFSFNEQSKYSETIIGSKVNIATVNATEFNVVMTSGYLNPPQGATHYKSIVHYAVLDVVAQTVSSSTEVTGGLPAASLPATLEFAQQTTAVSFPALLPTEMLVACVGVAFYQQVNGQLYPLKNDARLPFEIVHILR
jgi:hypothetical protein